jgi:MoaA/NifB/PqqE/SkfB family radical SAM enzyme
MNINKEYLFSEDNKVFCMAPWINFYVNTNSDIQPCCAYHGLWESTVNNFLSDYKSTLEVYNSDNFKKIRLNMLYSIQNNNCEQCYNMERNNMRSNRMVFNDHIIYEKDLYDIVNNTNKDGSLNKLDIKILDIKFSNKCNFKCRDCNSVLSSSWYDDEHILLNKKRTTKKIINSTENGNLEKLLNLFKYVKRIDIAGGESLISDEHYNMLDFLIENKRNDDIYLCYITNFSTTSIGNYDVIEYWKKFKNITISISFDDIYKRAEYFRKGLNFNKLIENIKKYQDLNHILNINTTINIHNVYYIPEIYKFLIENNILKDSNRWYVNILYYPNEYCIDVIPMFFKNIIKNKLINSINEIKNNFLHKNIENYEKSINDILNVMFKKDNSLNIKSFQNKTNELDKIRNENFKEIFSEIAFFLDI